MKSMSDKPEFVYLKRGSVMIEIDGLPLDSVVGFGGRAPASVTVTREGVLKDWRWGALRFAWRRRRLRGAKQPT